jgi:hypothetical protein
MTPAAVTDYKDLLKSLKDEHNIGDVYQQLMSKEQARIDLVNRMVEQNENKIWEDTIFYNRSILTIALDFAGAWKAIFNDIYVERRFNEWQSVFYDGDRKIYVGMMIVLVALVLFFVSSST